MLVTSGQLDSYALPDIDQILFSVPVWNAQGHTCDFGPHAAGLTIKTRTGQVRIPFAQGIVSRFMLFVPCDKSKIIHCKKAWSNNDMSSLQ